MPVSTDFTDGTLSGIVTVGSGRTSFTKTLVADLTTEGLETFVVNLRTGSASGPIVSTSPLISLIDSSVAVSVISVTSYSLWTSLSSIGSNVSIVGNSGTVYSLPVVADPDGIKSLRFPVTWPSSFYTNINQNNNYSFTMLSSDHNIMKDITYIFNGQTFGVYPISGASESCCDPYSMTFSSISLFNIRGTFTNTYQKITLSSTLSTNSGNVNYTTDGSVNGGNGLTGASGFFYLR